MDYDWRSEPAADVKQRFLNRRTSGRAEDRSGVWRYRELLPFIEDSAKIVTLGEGNTPIYEASRSAEYSGLDSIRLKHQGMNPTGSFKDNGMTAGVSQANVLGATAVACASTGNTSASMAAYAARANMRAYVFIPAGHVASGKLSQALDYGATVIEIEGSFDDAMRIVRELALETDLYLLNSMNPFRLEGQKAIIIEMMEQLGWLAPDWIIVPGGNLGNTSAFGKALKELHDLGFIGRIPRLAVIQAEGASPFFSLFNSSDRSRLISNPHPSTLATAIRIGNPVSWKKALRTLALTDGVVERVTEDEIADAKAVIGRDGIGCEPASAATVAGVKKLTSSGKIGRDDSVVCVLTGNLLKDPDYTVDYHKGALKFDDGAGERLVPGSFRNLPVHAAADKQAIRNKLGI